MSGIIEGKRYRGKLDVKKIIQNDPKIVNSFSSFLIGHLTKSIKSRWLKVDSLTAES